MMLKNPAFTVIVILILAIGIGANTAMFNALDQVYMRPLPVRKPHELVSVQFRYRHRSWEDIMAGSSYSTYEAYRDHSELFTALMGFKGQTLSLRVNDIVESIDGIAVSTNYFSTLGIQPALGRLIMPEKEQAPTAYQPVAVISHRLWRRCFGGRPDVIGKQIILNDQVLTVIGITPRGFSGTIVGHPADIFIPLGTAAHIQGGQVHDLQDVCQLGRLKPGIDPKQAQATLQVLDAQMNPTKSNEPEIRALLFDGSQGYVPRDARVASYPLALFLGIAALVLVIACANVANLQLVRALTRQKEIAVRRALGAGRWRVMRQLLVESVLLALAAGACGILLAVGLDRIICTVLPQLVSAGMPDMPAAHRFHITPGLHPRVLLFAIAISLSTGIAFGLTPALQMVRRDVVPALKESTGYIALPARHWNPHNLLVVGQIMVAVVVTVCSGLCLRNVIELKYTDPGFDPARIIAIRIDQEGWLTDRPELRLFMEDLQERVNHLPGVRSTGLTLSAPLGESGGKTQMTNIEGFDLPPGIKPDLYHGIVSSGYFQTLGQTLLAGRDFTVHDGPNAPAVMIIDEVFARRYWPDQDPIGKHVTLTSTMRQRTPVRTIVGIVKAVKLRSILEESRPWAYFPLAQHPRFTPALLVRTDGSPKALIPMIRDEAAAIQPAPGCDVRTVGERIWQLLLPQRILTGILNSFALVGLFLSATGIYAVMAYAVRQRTHEIGIRIALGAQDRHVLAPVLLRGVLLLTLGLGLGLSLSLAGARLLTGLLPQIREWDKFFLRGIYTWDPLTYIGATLVIVIVTLTACYIPARRAAKIDPMEALRYE
jgi:putative ABC transport system permease protein